MDEKEINLGWTNSKTLKRKVNEKWVRNSSIHVIYDVIYQESGADKKLGHPQIRQRPHKRETNG